jgi:hypothetical protein
MAEVAALVLLTAQDLFASPIPPALEELCALPSASPVRLWIRHYARRWLLTDMPGNKLNLLLQRHFFSDNGVWRHYLADRLLPRGKNPVLCEGIKESTANSLVYRAANLRFQIGRAWHHLTTGAGFAAACVAWELSLRANQNSISQTKLRGEQ